MMIPSSMAASIRRVKGAARETPGILFAPSPAFKKFMADPARRILLRAANRTGKTTHAAHRLAMWMEAQPGLRARAVSVNYQQGIAVLGLALAEAIPARRLAPGCTYTRTTGWSHSLIRLANGSECEIRSSDQLPIAHAGTSRHVVWIDEIPKPDILDENLARVMDTQGSIWLTATPVGRPVEHLMERVEKGGWKEYVVPFTQQTCPWYQREQVEAWLLEAQAAPWSYRQRIFADWTGVAVDRIYTAFDPDVHIVSKITKGDYHVGIGMDHGERGGNEVAVLLIWSGALKQMYVIDEYASPEATSIEQDARGLLSMVARNGFRPEQIEKIVADSNSAGKARPGYTINALLEKHLYDITSHRWRIDTPDKRGGSVESGEWLLNFALQEGRLKVMEDCAGVIDTGRYYDGKEKHKHFSDAVRYLAAPILSEWGIMPTAKLYWRQ